MAAIIQVEQVSKTFARWTADASLRQPPAGFWRGRHKEQLHALQDVSFEVRPGEMLGVVGANGAGKSTLLRLLGGVGQPTTGHIAVNGRIGALLELGGGFQPDLTGRENAILAGVVAGLLRREVTARLPEIVRFAELEEFIDAPVRTYSAGMTMRLAFAVAIHTDPEVLLVDEYLSVGDLAFQAKCTARISALREQGCAIVLVSHGMEQVRDLCDRALWLRHGRVVALDDAKTVAEAYEREMREETLRRTPDVPVRVTAAGTELRPRENRMGSLEMEITDVALRPGPVISSGDPLAVEISYRSEKPLASPVFVVSIHHADGTLCLDLNSRDARAPVPDLTGSGTVTVRFERLDLAKGSYLLSAGVFDTEWKHAYDYHWQAYPLTVDGGHAGKGVLVPPTKWSIDN